MAVAYVLEADPVDAGKAQNVYPEQEMLADLIHLAD